MLFSGLYQICTTDTGHAVGVGGQMVSGQVRVAPHHRGRLPSAQFLQCEQRRAALHMPRGPGVPQVVSAEIRDPGAFQRNRPVMSSCPM